jgi:hypothetical protein
MADVNIATPANPPSAGFFTPIDKTHAAITLAKAIGKTLTPELAAEIARELFQSPDLARPPGFFEPGAYKGYVFALESFRAILPELHALHVMQYTETETYRAGIPLNPDYDAIARSEHDGQLMQFTARRDGVLVGNMRIYLTQSRHTQTLVASEDTFYFLPEHRRGFLAVRLWQYVERCVIAAGAREIFFDSKTVNRADSIATYLKYKPFGIKFSKVIS